MFQLQNFISVLILLLVSFKDEYYIMTTAHPERNEREIKWSRELYKRRKTELYGMERLK
jgi:hypothetical protein